MTTPTISELDEQIAALKRQRDIASLAGLEDFQEILKRPTTVAIGDDLEVILVNLPTGEMAHQQAKNVITVIRQVSGLIDAEVARVTTLVANQVA